MTNKILLGGEVGGEREKGEQERGDRREGGGRTGKDDKVYLLYIITCR